MEENYIELIFETGTPELSEILIACLSEASEIEGFEETENGELVKVYIPASKFEATFPERFSLPEGIKYTQRVMQNKNWNAIWESGFEPVIINNFVSVRADFHKRIADTEYEIVITPKMSFGTGHHATTSLMLESLRHFNCEAKTLADFGTGTGVLAILAHKMKAKEVWAVDCDDWSIRNAAENLERNDAQTIRLLQTDVFPNEKHWDIIMANINLRVILDNMPRFYEGLNEKGVLIISGILPEDKDQVESLAHSLRLETEYLRQKNNWLCMAFRKKFLN